jgi:hypothetical protein
MKRLALLCLITYFATRRATAQSTGIQQGMIIKSGTSIRLGSMMILNKRTLNSIRSSTIGVFNISAQVGDTLEFKSENYQMTNFIVSDFMDKIIFMEPVIQLDEVVIKENSIKSDIIEAQRGYREKSVFYTGTPHYYYLFLKPMTFIYENFKSEVKNARKFNKYAKMELTSYQIAERFNDILIKKTIPIKNAELEDFKSKYTPTLSQLNIWSDYDLINYIISSYGDFTKKR